MKLQMLNSFTNFLEKSVNKTPNLVVALPDLPDLNYISHSVGKSNIKLKFPTLDGNHIYMSAYFAFFSNPLVPFTKGFSKG